MKIAGESQFKGSIDTITMVRNCVSMPRRDELLERGFISKPGNLPGTIIWFSNGKDEIYEPVITYYQEWWRRWRQSVRISIPKMVSGDQCDNICLPDHQTILNKIESVSVNVFERTGEAFDAFTSPVSRVDFAINLPCDPHSIPAFMAHYSRHRISWLVRQTISSESETVYFRNQSRGIRIYDKRGQIIREFPERHDLAERARGIVRIEYYFLNGTSVKRFAERLGISDVTVRSIISTDFVETATSELVGLLQLQAIDFSSGESFREIFEKTGGNMKVAISLFGFKGAIEAHGENFHRDPELGFSKSTYDRYRRKCQQFGISL